MDEPSRLEDLEIKCAHLEKTLLELGDELYAQQQQLETVLRLCRELARQVEGSAATHSAARPEDEIPPHY
jgi:SlyX protein